VLIDDIDFKILEILQSNGRIKRNQLADSVGLSIPSISERLRKLEESGYILGYYAHVNPKKLGKDVTAFIAVIIDSSKHYPSFIEHSNHLEDILECHAITGEGSYLLKIRTEDTTSLEKLLAKIQSWPGVMGTRTQLVLSSPKESMQIKLPNHK
jgi:Lrp/AsnC family transcriptional regulator, leucine-responsive regulatory protein